MKGLARFFICWAIACAFGATVFLGWKSGPMDFVFAMFDPSWAIAAAVAAFVWSKLAGRQSAVDQSPVAESQDAQ
ncbi:hypothetical protein ACQVBX_05320 [Dyella sp. KULCS107]|uniref:hypothetical protein n=1 Tax=Dyella sp. KULCS107 TaxID=3422216 RepID=UPI003D6EE594